jgi:hypothetical protein
LFHPRWAEFAGKIFDMAEDRAECARSLHLIDSTSDERPANL